MKDNRSQLEIKLAAAKRVFMWHFLNQKLDLVLVTEFPKSGGSWFGQMLSEALQIPFPRNRSAKLERSLMQGHYLYSKNFNKVICVMRDGRDVMVSAYYHFLFDNDRNPSFSVKKWRKALPFEDYNDIRTNLPHFIKHMFSSYKVFNKPVTWSDFVNDYSENQNALIVKYEDLKKQPVIELQRSLEFLNEEMKIKEYLQEIIDKYSFKNLSKREPGQENKKSFMRKGIVGDWKNNFTTESATVFDELAGEELIKMGYEKDRLWY